MNSVFDVGEKVQTGQKGLDTFTLCMSAPTSPTTFARSLCRQILYTDFDEYSFNEIRRSKPHNQAFALNECLKYVVCIAEMKSDCTVPHFD